MTRSERDWVVTDKLDRDVLRAVSREEDANCHGWRPWRGSYARAQRLAKKGLLQKAGISVMPPHVVYVMTDEGRRELLIADGQKLDAESIQSR